MRLLGKLLLVLGLVLPTWGALPTSTVFEVRNASAGATAGGCFVTGSSGTDYTQQTSPQFDGVNLAIDASNSAIVRSATHNFVATDVGNCLRITGGTGFTGGFYYIVSTASNAATLDRSAGTTSSTGGTWYVGGALGSLSELNLSMCSGCTAWVKADSTYQITAKVTFNYSNSGVSWIAGYTTTRGDNGKFTLQATSTFGDYMIDTNMGNSFIFQNVIFDANSETGVSCFRFLAQQNQANNIECKNFSSGSAQIQFNNIRNMCHLCYVHDGVSSTNVVQFSNSEDLCWGCTIRAVTGSGTTGFSISEGTCIYCTVDSLTSSSSDAFGALGSQGPVFLDHIVVYNITRDAFRITQINNSQTVIQNVVVSTTATVVDNTSGTSLRANDAFLDYIFYYNISGTAFTNAVAGSHSVSLSIDPFTSASTHDFTLNNKTTGGGAVRAQGAPSSLQGVLGTFYPDPGIAQHQDPKFIR